MNKTLFLPILATSLAHYLSNAIVMPVKYIKGDRNSDAQIRFPNSLLLTEGTLIEGESDCAFELVLTDEEISQLENLAEGIYSYNDILPVSRIKKIIFTDEKQAKNNINLVSLSTAFVPKALVEVNPHATFISIRECKTPLADNNLSAKIKKYDHILGGISLLRTITSEKQEYSLPFYVMLSRYNNLIKECLQSNKVSFDFLQGLKKYDILNDYLGNTISPDIVEVVAQREHQRIKKGITGMINVDNLKDATLVASVLMDFKVDDEDHGRQKIDGLLIDRFSQFGDEAPYIAFYYGFNRGYSRFAKSYPGLVYKLEFNSQVDYYTVESIYQFCIGKKGVGVFPYIDSWCPKQKVGRIGRGQIQILDSVVTVTKKKEVFSQAWWKDFFATWLDKFKDAIWQKGSEGFREEMKSCIVSCANEKADEVAYGYEKKIEDSKVEIQNLHKQIDEMKAQVAFYQTKFENSGKEVINQEGPNDSVSEKKSEQIFKDITQYPKDGMSNDDGNMVAELAPYDMNNVSKQEKNELVTYVLNLCSKKLRELKEEAKKLGITKLSKEKNAIIRQIIDNRLNDENRQQSLPL